MDNSEILDDNGSENFENMLEQSLIKTDQFEVGDKVKGNVISITGDTIFVDISGKSEAILDLAECTDEDGSINVEVGDEIDIYITSIKGGEISLTKNIGLGNINEEIIKLAFNENIPVSGKVLSTTKGGFLVSLSGIRCFCPMSQIDSKPVNDPNFFIEKTFEFKVIQFGERGKNIILSRRTLLDEMKQLREDELKEHLNVGDKVNGIIRSIKNFGIFIDLGGFEALVPKSELSWSRNTPTNQFKEGESAEALVKAIDWNKSQVTLSIKELTEAPWSKIDQYSVGQEINGTVVNIIKNGVFIEIATGLEGFIHISRLSLLKKINKPEEVVTRGDSVSVKITNINTEEKKIALDLMTDGPDPWQTPEKELKDTIHEATIESVQNNGVQGRLSNGMLGFIPRDQLLNGKNTDIQQEYPVGKNIKVAIKDFKANNKKLILSESGAIAKEERKEFEKFMNNESSASGSSLGSLFKQQFEKIQNDIKE